MSAHRVRAAVWAPPILVAFALRAVAGIAASAGARGQRGFDFYGFMADHVLDGRGLCWAFYDGLGWKFANRGPLYPLLVAAVRAVAGSPGTIAVVLVQSLLGAAAAAVPAVLAARWGGDRAARWALWIAALWPYSVLADTGLVEHVLYAPLCVLSVWAAARACDRPGATRPALFAGAIAGLAVLARLTFAVTLPFLGAFVLRRRGAAAALLVALGASAAILPWVVRNHQVVGHWVLGTDGGRALWVGNAPATFAHYPAASIDEGERALVRGLPPETLAELRALGRDEVAQDARFRSMAVAAIADDPAGASFRALRKAAAQWSPVYNPGPASPVKLAVFAATLVPLLAAACAGVATQPRMRADLPAVLAALGSFTLVAAVFWGQPRYLAPLHGLGIAAAAAWCARRPGAAPCGPLARNRTEPPLLAEVRT